MPADIHDGGNPSTSVLRHVQVSGDVDLRKALEGESLDRVRRPIQSPRHLGVQRSAFRPGQETQHVPHFLKPAGSDRLRLGDPQQPVINPYEGPKRTLFLSRNAVAKLRGRVLQDLQNLVDQGAVGSPEVRQRMSDSMRRVNSMCDRMAHLNAMADAIIYNTLANSSG